VKWVRAAAIVFAALTAGIVAFQLALAAGAPWGDYAMGGAYSGVYPPPMRAAAVVQAVVLAVFALVVLARAGLPPRRWARVARWLVWVVVVLSAVSLVLNLATPSGGERALWAPVAAVMLAANLVVAVGARREARVRQS